eukprot:9494293-Pyramimonas_sp.AAC.1
MQAEASTNNLIVTTNPDASSLFVHTVCVVSRCARKDRIRLSQIGPHGGSIEPNVVDPAVSLGPCGTPVGLTTDLNHHRVLELAFWRECA